MDLDELKEKSMKLDKVNALLKLNEKENIIIDDEIEKNDKEKEKEQDHNKDLFR